MRHVPMRAGGAIPRLFLFLAAATAASLVASSCVYADSTIDLSDDDYPAMQPGHASYYGQEFAGRRTASGDIFNPNALTAAHRTLPIGTKVRVTNVDNGRSVLVTITDRGPYIRNREIDLSEGAARQLQMVRRGVVEVIIQPL